MADWDPDVLRGDLLYRKSITDHLVVQHTFDCACALSSIDLTSAAVWLPFPLEPPPSLINWAPWQISSEEMGSVLQPGQELRSEGGEQMNQWQFRAKGLKMSIHNISTTNTHEENPVYNMWNLIFANSFLLVNRNGFKVITYAWQAWTPYTAG